MPSHPQPQDERRTANAVTAIAHPNIALAKYWGKAHADANVPAVPSVSITLADLGTRTRVSRISGTADRIHLDGRPLVADDPRAERMVRCLAELRALSVRRDALEVHSCNDFPTAAGLASSASGFAALVTAAAAALEVDLPPAAASRLARRASASAARSMHGGFVLLPAGGTGDDPAAEQIAPAEHWPLEVVVALCSEDAKTVGSTRGMLASERSSPFYPAWVEQAPASARAIRAAVENRDFDALAAASEHSCLAMHGVMTTTSPPLLYWNPGTVAVIHAVRGLRAAGTEVFFTIDAGPQVKAVCAPGAGAAVARELEAVPGVRRVLTSGLGGPARVLEAP